jgi:polyglutamine-binding protein 1
VITELPLILCKATCFSLAIFFAAHEEVFAEDYDDDSGSDDNQEQLIHESIDCPNRTNPYHTCVAYCRRRWGLKKFKADDSLEKRRLRMLRKYPLPAGWLEVGDPET